MSPDLYKTAWKTTALPVYHLVLQEITERSFGLPELRSHLYIVPESIMSFHATAMSCSALNSASVGEKSDEASFHESRPLVSAQSLVPAGLVRL